MEEYKINVRKKNAIRKSLIEQLDTKGAKVAHFEDLIDDYMTLWEIKSKLQFDIDQRGVTYKDFSSVGIEMWKNNPSVKELTGVNKQMLSVLKELGLSTDNVREEEEDEDDFEM